MDQEQEEPKNKQKEEVEVMVAPKEQKIMTGDMKSDDKK